MQKTIGSHESFDIHFNCTGNPISNATNNRWFSKLHSLHLWHKINKYILFASERNSKVTLVVNFIPSKFWSFPQGVLKVVLHTGLNVYRKRFKILNLQLTVSWCAVSGQQKDLFHASSWFSQWLLSKFVPKCNSKQHALFMYCHKEKP